MSIPIMKEFDLYSDDNLMQKIKEGNMFAFDALYRKYVKKLYKFAYSLVKSHEEAENVIQEVFLNLWISRNKIEKNSSVKSYIFKLTHNSAISIIRKKVRDAKFIEYIKSIQEPSSDSIASQIEYSEMNKRLNKIIDELPGRQREVFTLHRIEGLKYCEISNRLNISMNTIENHMSRALKTILKKVGKVI